MLSTLPALLFEGCCRVKECQQFSVEITCELPPPSHPKKQPGLFEVYRWVQALEVFCQEILVIFMVMCFSIAQNLSPVGPEALIIYLIINMLCINHMNHLIIGVPNFDP
jgi:hypothetical protein